MTIQRCYPGDKVHPSVSSCASSDLRIIDVMREEDALRIWFSRNLEIEDKFQRERQSRCQLVGLQRQKQPPQPRGREESHQNQRCTLSAPPISSGNGYRSGDVRPVAAIPTAHCTSTARGETPRKNSVRFWNDLRARGEWISRQRIIRLNQSGPIDPYTPSTRSIAQMREEEPMEQKTIIEAQWKRAKGFVAQDEALGTQKDQRNTDAQQKVNDSSGNRVVDTAVPADIAFAEQVWDKCEELCRDHKARQKKGSVRPLVVIVANRDGYTFTYENTTYTIYPATLLPTQDNKKPVKCNHCGADLHTHPLARYFSCQGCYEMSTMHEDKNELIVLIF